jgi:hypothetical protein
VTLSTFGFQSTVFVCLFVVSWVSANRALHAQTPGFAVYTRCVNNIVYHTVATVIKMIYCLLLVCSQFRISHVYRTFCKSFPELLKSPLQYQCTSLLSLHSCLAVHCPDIGRSNCRGTNLVQVELNFCRNFSSSFASFLHDFLARGSQRLVDCFYGITGLLLFVGGEKVRCD